MEGATSELERRLCRLIACWLNSESQVKGLAALHRFGLGALGVEVPEMVVEACTRYGAGVDLEVTARRWAYPAVVRACDRDVVECSTR